MNKRFLIWLCCVLLAHSAAALAVSDSQNVTGTTSLKILEASMGTLPVAAPSSNVVIPLTIANASNTPVKVTFKDVWFLSDQEPVKSTIEDEGGTIVTTIEDGKGAIATPLEVPKNNTRRIVIRASLRKPAIYRGVLWIQYGQENSKESHVVLEVTRQPAAIDMAELGGAFHTIELCQSSPDVRFEAHVRNNGSGGIALQRPFLRSVVFKPKADATIAWPGASVRFAQPIKEFPVAGQSDAAIPLALSGINRPGRYDALIRLGGEGITPGEKTLVVYARDSYVILLLWVALGLLISFWMHTYGSVIRPRMLLERRVARMLENLRDYVSLAGDDVEAVSLMQTLRSQIASQLDRLSALGQLLGSTVFDAYETKVALAGQWLDRWKAIRTVRPESVRAEMVTSLRAVAMVLKNSAATSDNLTQQQQVLDELPQTVDNRLMDVLGKTLTDFLAALQAKADPRFDNLGKEAERVRALLKPGSIDEAFEALSAVRKKYLDIVATDLLRKLDGAKPPPGFDDGSWRRVVERTTEAIRSAQGESDPDAAASKFANAVSSYLRTVANGLAGYVAGKIEDGSDPKDKYLSLQTDINGIIISLDAGKIDDAMRGTDQVIGRLQHVAKGAAAQMAMLTAAAAQLPAATGFDLFNVFQRGASASQLGRAGSATRIQRAIDGLDWLAAIVAVVLTMFIAYQTLWVSDLTWGGPGAYISAVLWGAGIHQLTWTGLSGLANALRG